jgi:CHRD domain-containing protein
MRTRREKASAVCVAVLMSVAAATTINAQQVVLQGSGSGAFDNPIQANAAVAFAQCTVDRTAQTISCSSRVYNIVDLIAAHIHIGGPGTSGAVIIGIPNLPLHVSGTFAQSWTWTATDFVPSLQNAGLGLNSLDDLINSCVAGGCYLNWHTTAATTGAVRVNLCPTNRAANTINAISICP